MTEQNNKKKKNKDRQSGNTEELTKKEFMEALEKSTKKIDKDKKDD